LKKRKKNLERLSPTTNTMHVLHTTEEGIVAETTTRGAVDAFTRTNVTTIVQTAGVVVIVTDALVAEEVGGRIMVDSMVDHMTDVAVGVIIRDTRILTEVLLKGLRTVLVVTSRRILTSTSSSNNNNSSSSSNNNNDMLLMLPHLSTGNVFRDS
jgi:hypothetical protein